MTGRKAIQLLCVVLSLGALFWLLRRIGWGVVADAIGRVGWKGATVLFALAFAEASLDGTALWLVMGRPLQLGFAIAVNAAGSTMNLVLPWESGEFLKGGLLRGLFGTGRAISGTVIWNYVFKLARPTVSLATALLAWMLCRSVDSQLMLIVIAANVLAFAPYAVLRVLIRYGAAAGFLHVVRMIPLVGRHPARWGETARQIDRQVKSFEGEDRSRFVKVFLVQVAARLTGWASIYVAFRAIGLGYDFGQATLIYATMNVADYVISMLPARVGVSEGTAFFVFKLFGMDPAMGLIVYAVLRARTMLANGIVTPFAFLHGKPAEPHQGRE